MCVLGVFDLVSGGRILYAMNGRPVRRGVSQLIATGVRVATS